MASTPKPRFQTLDALNASQQEAIRAIPPYGTQPPPVMTRHYAVSNFTDNERFALERERVFRRLPVPIIPSARLPEPKTVLAHDGYGLPLAIVRDKEGKVRVFLNACKHKGAKLVERCDAHKAVRLTCPYHSWTYALDGKLLAIARDDAFDSIDKADFPLTELPSREFGGIVWAVLDPKAKPDFSTLDPALGADLDSLEIPRAHLYDHKSFDLEANWKLVLEPFMESYHVPRLHASSIGQLFGDVTRIIDLLGPHQRKVAGKVDYQPEMLDETDGNIHKIVTFAYQLFPNAVLITSPYYTSLMILMPRSERRTRVDYYMLLLEEPLTEKAKEVAKRSFDLVLKVFGGEDFRAAEISQEGLESGALDQMTYGGMENTIPMFYDQLDECLRRAS